MMPFLIISRILPSMYTTPRGLLLIVLILLFRLFLVSFFLCIVVMNTLRSSSPSVLYFGRWFAVLCHSLYISNMAILGCFLLRSEAYWGEELSIYYPHQGKYHDTAVVACIKR